MHSGTHTNGHLVGIWKTLKRWDLALSALKIPANRANTTAHGQRRFFDTHDPFGQRKLSGPLVLQSAVASLATTPGDCRAGDEYTMQRMVRCGFGWLVGWLVFGGN